MIACCTIEGCGGDVHARGWCENHYTRWRRHDRTHRIYRTRNPRQPPREGFLCLTCGAPLVDHSITNNPCVPPRYYEPQMSIEIVPNSGGSILLEADKADIVLRVTGRYKGRGFALVALDPVEARALAEALAAAADTLEPGPTVDDVVGILEGGPDSVTWLREQREGS